MRLKLPLLFLLPLLLNAQDPVAPSHPSLPEHKSGEVSEEETSHAHGHPHAEGTQNPGGFDLQKIHDAPAASLMTDRQKAIFQEAITKAAWGRAPYAEAAELKAAFQTRSYPGAGSAVNVLVSRYRAELDTSRREALGTEIKFVQYANWDFQINVGKDGRLESWQWIGNAMETARPEKSAPSGARIYIEGDVKPGAVGAQTHSLHIKAALASPDYIYDEATKKTFRRITKDEFDPANPSGRYNNMCNPSPAAPQCVVFLVTK